MADDTNDTTDTADDEYEPLFDVKRELDESEIVVETVHFADGSTVMGIPVSGSLTVSDGKKLTDGTIIKRETSVVEEY
jgi:hypothetical protein